MHFPVSNFFFSLGREEFIEKIDQGTSIGRKTRTFFFTKKGAKKKKQGFFGKILRKNVTDTLQDHRQFYSETVADKKNKQERKRRWWVDDYELGLQPHHTQTIHSYSPPFSFSLLSLSPQEVSSCLEVVVKISLNFQSLDVFFFQIVFVRSIKKTRSPRTIYYLTKWWVNEYSLSSF